MSKLMKATQWAKREFEAGSEPDTRTIKKWVRDNLVKGRIVDGHVWICSSEKWGVESDVNMAVRRLINET
ncbi:hypothetical protein EH228_08745 [Erwinia endophytica]|uniref:hypothetical protein n=1 Tax=Erwinia endophytica TaxID=1563158 RepID=UPI001265E782|nr:hypothetical protein [Erwinia endophytica]KAB8312260.1 hypothetical protein EH228_08745 [Erwinia endophytica]